MFLIVDMTSFKCLAEAISSSLNIRNSILGDNFLKQFSRSGSVRPHPGSPGEQQLWGRQHQHRAGRQRVVRRARGLLGAPAGALPDEECRLSARQLVAEDGGR